MTCLVDDLGPTTPTKTWPYKQSCHLVCERGMELDRMAVRLGLKPHWKQKQQTPGEHYDLTSRKRTLAIKMGAIPVSRRTLAEFVRDKTTV
jgi:hypothetical protein